MTADFAPLPQPNSADGTPRRVGVEIEFGGVDEAHAASIAADILGGTAHEDGTATRNVSGGTLGKLEIYLDSTWRNSRHEAVRTATETLGRDLIPVEIVTEPIPVSDLPQLSRLCDALREAGAEGTKAGLLNGFGLHYNIQTVSDADGDICRPLLAYALIESWMRRAQPIDQSRAVLPFTDPYPTRLVRALCDLGPDAARADVQDAYLSHAPDRNYGLDMLPIFATFDEETVRDRMKSHKLSPRPAFHFRLPESRIDESDWSLADEWQRWVIVERVAADTALLGQLIEGWQDEHGAITLSRRAWAERCGDILATHGLMTGRGDAAGSAA
ncbi:MAG: amidoligase family protein [Celeribacter sp.]